MFFSRFLSIFSGSLGKKVTPTPSREASAAALSDIKLLIVDNEDDFLFLIKRMLRRLPFSVATAGDGQGALDIIGQDPPHIVFADIRMPILDGYQLVKRIRQSKVGKIKDLPVVAITSYSGEEAHERIMQAGFTACLFKPFEKDDLIRVLARSLNMELENVHESAS